jgi:hypothetical protein
MDAVEAKPPASGRGLAPEARIEQSKRLASRGQSDKPENADHCEPPDDRGRESTGATQKRRRHSGA